MTVMTVVYVNQLIGRSSMEVNFPLVGLSLMISSGVLFCMGEYLLALASLGMLYVFIQMAGSQI